MSAPLDELREQVKKRARLTKAIDELFDTFEDQHHGLVDLTKCGKQCPAWWRPLAAFPETPGLCVVMHKDAPTGEPCACLPACAAKGDS